ncbi:hypothetical protein LEMLEM_LOCUS12797, partial [Lemmus lemmus]
FWGRAWKTFGSAALGFPCWSFKDKTPKLHLKKVCLDFTDHVQGIPGPLMAIWASIALLSSCQEESTKLACSTASCKLQAQPC